MKTQRIQKLQQTLEPGSTLIVEKEVDLLYLTELELSAGSLLVTPEEAALRVDSRYFEFCVKYSPIPVLLADKTPLAIEGQTLCFDAEATSYARFLELQKLGVPLKAVQHPVALLRMIKEPEEIELLRQAAALGIEGFDFVQTLLTEGVREDTLARELEIFWKRRGADKVAFEPIIAFGPHSAMPHYRHGDQALKPGMNVLIDIGVQWKHYASDRTRVLFFGDPHPKLQEIYAIVAEAQEAALALCRPGTLIGELDRTARELIAKRGYGEFFGHSLGHGVGLEIHELPSLRQKPPFNEMPLQAGMVITIEPGIYLPGTGGVRLEDTVVITNEGHENLTRHV